MYICNHQRLDGETGSQSDWQLFNDTMLRLAKMADDNVITKEEKATLRDTWNQIQKEFTAYQAQATKYGVSITALQNAYNTLNTFLTNTVKIAQDIDSNLSVAQKTEYNQDFANYYSERTAFANVIAQKVADESVGNLQIGMVNLLKGSNVELNRQNYNVGRYYWDKIPETGKTYTLVVCYTLGTNNTYISAYSNVNTGSVIKNLSTHGDKVVESHTFTPSREFGGSIAFYQFPNDGTYGSKVHWAVLVEGNKGPNSWIPSQADNDAKAQSIAKAEAELAETKANAYADGIVTEAEQNAINEAQARLDALKIGSVNLISKKMMLAWNEKNKDIAVWGQDSDGIYLGINQGALYTYVCGGTAHNDLFGGTIKYKDNTQYVFQVKWKLAGEQTNDNSGVSFWVLYTDGTNDGMRLGSLQTSLIVESFITKKGKTVAKIFSSYGANTYRSLIYSLAFYEGNKVLAEPPVATEDLTGQSNVNLLDNSKFQFGTKGYEPNNQSTLNIVNEILQSRSSQTSGTPGVRLPIVHLNQGVYSFKVIVKGINIPSCYIAVYKGDMSGFIASTREYVSILPTFTEKSLTFANSEEGDYRIIILWNASTATAYPAGLDIEYSILVEGFTSPSSYSPSPGDVAKDIKDVSDAVSNLDTTINTTFKDGIISEAEAKAIASNINVLNAEKADIDAYYTKLYANAYLTGTAKTNLASAKTAYNTAHTNLINSINTAIADGKTTATEKADVDAKFSAYNNALSAYQTRVGEADKAIQDTIKKVADDAQTSANAAQSAADAAQSAANQAQADANAANSKLATWASDNYISPQEKTALRQQKSDIQAEYNDIVANANRYNISLTSYSAAYNSAIDALNKYTATSPENIAVSSDYNNISAYYPARQTILNSIAAAAKAQADKATGAIGMDGGKMLYADPEFRNGLNKVYKYTNSSNVDPDYIASKLTVERVTKPSDAPTQSGYCLKVTCKAAQIPGYGGVYQPITSRANAVFVQKIIAKIPVDRKINTHSNSMGTGYTDTWLTSNAGTGKYETYVRKVVCGTTGNFSVGGIVYISGGPAPTESDPLEWYIAYMTAFDLTADGYGDIEYNAKDDLAQQLGYSNFDEMVTAAKKGDTLIDGGYINTQLIDVETLVADTALVDKLIGRELNFTLGSVGGFKMESTLLYSGAKFGTGGAGIAMQSMTNNYGFNVYKDNNNYVEMFQRSSEWGLKGVVNGSPVFQFGSTNKIGPFSYTGNLLVADNPYMLENGYKYDGGLVLSPNHIYFKYAMGSIYQQSVYIGVKGEHGSSSYGDNTVLGVEGGDIWHQAGDFYASNIRLRGDMDVYNNSIIRMKGQIHFDNVVTYTGSGAVTITADSGHFIYLTPITGNPVVSVSSGLPIGSWFIIAHATTAGGFYYIKLSGSDRFRRRGNAYQQVNSNNQDPSLIFKVNNTTWVIGNLPVNWIDWN